MFHRFLKRQTVFDWHTGCMYFGKSVRQHMFLWKEGYGKENERSSIYRSCQKAMALAAATFRESTPWAMGIHTV